MTKATEKFFHPDRKLNWHKDDSQKIRRQKALNSRHSSFLKAGRALQALANVSNDSETARKAKADATFFFAQHKKRQELKSKIRRK